MLYIASVYTSVMSFPVTSWEATTCVLLLQLQLAVPAGVGAIASDRLMVCVLDRMVCATVVCLLGLRVRLRARVRMYVCMCA